MSEIRDKVIKEISDILRRRNKTLLLYGQNPTLGYDADKILSIPELAIVDRDAERPKLSDYDKRQTTDSSVDFQNGFLVAKGAFIQAGYVLEVKE